MGGKSDDSSVSTVATPAASQDNSAMMQQMNEMMAMSMSMMGEMAASAATPTIADVPEVLRTPEIDWTEKQNQLTAKTKAEYNVDNARRKGRTDTVLTSPLLDDEEVSTTSSILAG